MNLLERNISEVIVKEDLEKKLASGQKLRIKHGIDPTGPKIHIGRAVALWKLREFQELGHKIVLIIGDFTALIGDASDKLNKRPTLSKKQVKENMKDYLPQIGKILDVQKAEVHYNSEWLEKFALLDFLNLKQRFTAQQLIQRRNFKQRWDQNKEIGAHELDYPILQGYDSVAVKADAELGGSDQLFNLKAGRKVQEAFKQESQNIITIKMLMGLDGRKMSTSWGNVVNISDEPQDMFGKIMSMRDNGMSDYFGLATRLEMIEISELLKQEPRSAKARLAYEIVKLYHGQEKAKKASEEFDRVFKDKKLPEDIPEFKLKNKNLDMAGLLMGTGMVKSKNQARRLIEQGGVKFENNILRVGRRRFARIV